MTPARILAPVALVAAAIALFIVVGSGSDASDEKSAHPSPTATAAAKSRTKPKATATPGGRTYTVKPGDTPSGIAAAEGVEVDALLEANPDIDPSALTVGEKIKLP
jgi:LysM repeat protein